MAHVFKLEAIEPNRRLVVHSQIIEELRLSINKNGQIEPILIYQQGLSFRIIDGEKRWRAMKILKRSTIMAELSKK